MGTVDVDPVADDQQNLLFSNVTFTIVSTRASPADYVHEVKYVRHAWHAHMTDCDQISGLLEDNGAIYRPSDVEEGRITDLEGLTHIISTTADFSDYYAATAAFIPVVKPSWVTTSVKKQKLCNTRQHSPDPRMFMSGVTVLCADIPEGDKEAIFGGVAAMGGQPSGSMSRMVTHIVALSMDHAACELVRQKKLPCKIVLPHWFVPFSSSAAFNLGFL